MNIICYQIQSIGLECRIGVYSLCCGNLSGLSTAQCSMCSVSTSELTVTVIIWVRIRILQSYGALFTAELNAAIASKHYMTEEIATCLYKPHMQVPQLNCNGYIYTSNAAYLHRIKLQRYGSLCSSYI